MRAHAAGVCGLLYVVGATAFLLALLGELLGSFSIRGVDWLTWFMLEMCLGLAAVWLYPYDRPSRRIWLRMGLPRRGGRRPTADAPRT